MQDNEAQPIHNDGTVGAAAGLMPDIDQLEIDNGDREAPLERSRDDEGRFAKAQEEAGKEVEAEAKEPEAKEAADDTEADDGDWLEIEPGEEGAEPVRLKVDEVYEGYQRAKTLEQEVENLKQTTPPPPDYDQAIMQAIEQGSHYAARLREAEALLAPFEPDQNLINPQSPTYDPEAFFAQQQYAQQQKAQLEATQAERNRVEQEVREREEAVTQARFAREQQKLMTLWPELKEEATANQVRDQASRFYGLDQQTINSVQDSRFYHVLKDALAYRAQAEKSQTAVKAVKAKPKLVKGKARNQNPAQRRSQEGMDRLSQSGSIEDAMDALDGLL